MKASFFRLSVYTDCSQIFGPKMIQPASKHEVSPISRLTAKWWVQCRCLDLCQAVIKLWLQIIIDYFTPTQTSLIVTESNFVRYAWQPWFRVQGARLKTTHWTHFRGVAQRFSEIVILKLVDLCLANYIRKITQKNTFANASKIFLNIKN